MKKIYICRDEKTEILSAIYDAWKEQRDKEAGIGIRGKTEPELFCEYIEVAPSQRKADAVVRLIQKHMGRQVYEDISYAMLAEDAMKGDCIFHVMQAARRKKEGGAITGCLTNPYVAKLFEMKRKVANEAHHYIEFIRFRELKNGVMFSEIEPQNWVLPCIAGHFSNRFPLENWVIYDRKHAEAAVHAERRGWMLVKGAELDLMFGKTVTEEEKKYTELWKVFFRNVSIKERENSRLQQNHVPMKYRKDMTEFTGAGYKKDAKTEKVLYNKDSKKTKASL